VCFFFQAEDGIRDFHVTGVQTCALPILYSRNRITDNWTSLFQVSRNEDKSRTYTSPKASVIESQQDRYTWQNDIALGTDLLQIRSEERRVGKDSRSR